MQCLLIVFFLIVLFLAEYGNSSIFICVPHTFSLVQQPVLYLYAILLWLLTTACIKTGRPQIARRSIDLAETRLLKDSWPEYYDGKLGRYIRKQARKYQTWSIAGYLVANICDAAGRSFTLGDDFS